MNKASTEQFYATIPAFAGFVDILDPDRYFALPDDWVLGLSDVVSSTGAMAAGRYKAVNTAGAAIIAAVKNALPDLALPFVFGGDGASFAVPAAHAGIAGRALAATATWVREDLELEMRVAMIPVAEVRRAGLDVRIARFAASGAVSYAMFAGGGLGWAEAEMKAGRHLLPPAPTGSRPDLSGLSCRWGEIQSAQGIILSIIVTPGRTQDEAAWRAHIGALLSLIAQNPAAGRPLPEKGPPFRWPPAGFELEARAARREHEPLWRSRLRLAAHTLLAATFFVTRLKAGGFDPDRYIRETVENTDFRKYDDGLRMTIDCAPAMADRLEAMLEEGQRQGVLRYGLHRQQTAIITCIVQSALRSDHLHFLDGGAGGYAAAAQRLKAGAGQGT